MWSRLLFGAASSTQRPLPPSLKATSDASLYASFAASYRHLTPLIPVATSNAVSGLLRKVASLHKLSKEVPKQLWHFEDIRDADTLSTNVALDLTLLTQLLGIS